MPAFLIRHTKGQHGDILVEDDGLDVRFTDAWVLFAEADGTLALAVPTAHVASIQRVDDPEDQPAKE